MAEDRPRPFKEKLNLQIALIKFDSAFAECDKLPDMDKQEVLERIRERLHWHMPPSAEPPAPLKIGDQCRKLANNAPNEKIRNALLTIAQICDSEADAGTSS
jgi:hypothetical protein